MEGDDEAANFQTMFGQINLNNVQGELKNYVVRRVNMEYTVGKQIGRGGFGEVHEGKRKSDGLRVAIKHLYAEQLDPMDYISFCREIKVLSLTVNHPCLVSLVGFTTRSPYTIITPFIENGSLFDRLGKRKDPTPRLTTANKTIIAAGIAYGMIRLHEMAIIHRDLKSMNILLDKKLHPMICDFGISRSTRNAAQMTMNLGTPHWMAPEIMSSSAYTHKVDIYAYGILLWEILTEDIPFKDQRNAYLIQQIVIGGGRPPMPDNAPPSVKQLIEKCWSANPDERPEFEEIYRMFASGEVKFGDGDADNAVVNSYLDELGSHNLVYTTRRSAFNVRALMQQRQTPESLDNLTSTISVNNVMEFFGQCKTELAGTSDPELCRNIYDMITAVMNGGDAFVVAMLQAKIPEQLKWDVQESLESMHRVITTALHFVPTSFTHEDVMHMLDNLGIRGVQSLTILHALSVVFQRSIDNLNAIAPLVTKFLVASKDMVGKYSVIGVVQLLCLLWNHAREICTQNMQAFNGGLYYALKTNNPRACHDIYMFYASNTDVKWHMNDNLLLTHLGTRGTQYAALSYMVRSYIPDQPNYIPVLFNLAKEFETAGAILCSIANSEHAATLFGTKEAIDGIPMLGFESGIRMILLLAKIPNCKKLMFSSIEVLTYMRNLLNEKREMFTPIKEIIRLICASKEEAVFVALKDSGLLSTFDIMCFEENADDDMKKVLTAHAHCDRHVCPSNYKFLIDQYKKNLGRGEGFSMYILAALYPLSLYPEAQNYIVQRGILQVILQDDIPKDPNSNLRKYVVHVFKNCNVRLPDGI